MCTNVFYGKNNAKYDEMSRPNGGIRAYLAYEPSGADGRGNPSISEAGAGTA